VLLGVAMLAAIGALAFSLVLGARRLFERQGDWAERVRPASAALDLLTQDLACCLVPETGEEPFFRLAASAEGSVLLCVTAAPGENPEEPLSRFRVWRATWRLENGPGGAGRALVREARLEGVAGEAEEKSFRLPGVAGFEVRVYDPLKREWVRGWTARQGGALPAAARVAIRFRTSRGEETLRVDTVIPAGLKIGASAP
jgi:hypothetical protein